MAGRGQIPNPALRRYDAVSASPAVYLIEVGGGSVKVGCAVNAHARLRELHSSLIRDGFNPGQFSVFPLEYAQRMRVETECVASLRKVADQLPRRREYFTGISYDEALRIVSAELA